MSDDTRQHLADVWESVKAAVAEVEEDVSKSVAKGTLAAGTRTRTGTHRLRKLLAEVVKASRAHDAAVKAERKAVQESVPVAVEV
jgi:hypothetical protein